LNHARRFLTASRLYQRLGAIAIKAFPGSKGFGGKTAVHGRSRRNTNLPLNFFAASGSAGHDHPRESVPAFPRRPDTIPQHPRLVAAVNTARHDFRAAANEALILVAPLHEFRVAGGLFFDLLACHTQFSLLVAQFYFTASKARRRRVPDNAWRHHPRRR